MQMKKQKFILLACAINFFSAAQIIPYEKYTSKNGLISDRITAIEQDEKGFMWFGSYFGVCRYDGIKFEKIKLPLQQENKYVNSILSANDKVYISFAFQGGLAEYSKGKVTVHYVSEKDSLKVSEFFCMTAAQDGSIILCSGGNELYQFKSGNFKLLYTLPKETAGIMQSVVTDAEKNIWIGTERGLYFLPFPYQTHSIIYPENFFLSLSKDKTGCIWFNRNDGKKTIIGHFNSYQNGQLQETISYTSAKARFSRFSGNATNGFWLAEGSNTLTNITSTAIEHYQLAEGLNAELRVLYTDRENNLWISHEPGLLKVSNFSARSFLFHELAFGGGCVVQKNDSSLWATNSVSLYTISNRGIKKTGFKKPNDYIGLLHADVNKNLWIGHWNEGVSLTQWNNDNLVSEKYFSEFNHIKIKALNFVEDSKGNLWIGGLNGIFRVWNNKIVEHFHPKNASGRPAFVVCMAIDEANKTLWLGDNDNGIIRLNYNDSSAEHFVYKTTGYITSKNGLTDTYIRSLFADTKKNLWVGTRFGGIYKISISNKLFSVINMNATAGLSCARISQIVAQDSSEIWFATCDGIYKYNYSNNQWHHYNTSDGLLNAEVYSCSSDTKNGLIWSLTSEGITSLPFKINENNIPPLINITAINILGKPDTEALYSNKVVSYSNAQNSIGFRFTGLSFIDEKKIRYKYILQGYDKNWSEPVMSNSVNYASLPPGNYVFKVMAANSKNQWSKKPATFQFEIVMPFYKMPWFIFLLATTVVFIIYFIRIQRLRQRYKIEKLRLTIARDLHDDVGSALGSINILSKTATRRLDKNSSTESIAPVFQKIGQSAEDTLEAMDDIVWSINPDKDKLQDLVVRMREFAIPLLEAKNMNFNFVIEGNNTLIIPMNLRRNVFLIYKEAIHNILKHSNASAVEIKLQASAQLLQLTIMDNGRGFDQNQTTNRNGIKNIHNRAEIVNGSLTIHSSDKGTAISFAAPVR